MKRRNYLLNTLLALLVGTASLTGLLARTFAPTLILPRPDVPNLTLLSLAALLADHYLSGTGVRSWPCTALLAAAAFGLLPWCAGLIPFQETWKLAAAGGVVFTAAAWLFSAVRDRLSSGSAGRGAAALSALGLYLASLGFAGPLL